MEEGRGCNVQSAASSGYDKFRSLRLGASVAQSLTLYRIACVSDYFSYRIGLSFTVQRSDPVQHIGAKSLRSGGDTKSNPICAVP